MLVYPYDFVESATEEDSLSCRKDQNHFKICQKKRPRTFGRFVLVRKSQIFSIKQI